MVLTKDIGKEHFLSKSKSNENQKKTKTVWGSALSPLEQSLMAEKVQINYFIQMSTTENSYILCQSFS